MLYKISIRDDRHSVLRLCYIWSRCLNKHKSWEYCVSFLYGHCSDVLARVTLLVSLGTRWFQSQGGRYSIVHIRHNVEFLVTFTVQLLVSLPLFTTVHHSSTTLTMSSCIAWSELLGHYLVHLGILKHEIFSSVFATNEGNIFILRMFSIRTQLRICSSKLRPPAELHTSSVLVKLWTLRWQTNKYQTACLYDV